MILQRKDTEVSGEGTGEEDSALLSVEGLSVAYGPTGVVRNVGFSLARGESLALIGESGSGKSTIAKAILRLLPDGDARVAGSVKLAGVNCSPCRRSSSARSGDGLSASSRRTRVRP